jgi:hypothetical protein
MPVEIRPAAEGIRARAKRWSELPPSTRATSTGFGAEGVAASPVLPALVKGVEYGRLGLLVGWIGAAPGEARWFTPGPASRWGPYSAAPS